MKRLIREIEEETARERKRSGEDVAGAEAMLTVDPDTVPASTARSYAPKVHAASKEARTDFFVAYSWFAAEFRDAATELRTGNRDARFPEGCFPPGLPYVGKTGLPDSTDALLN